VEGSAAGWGSQSVSRAVSRSVGRSRRRQTREEGTSAAEVGLGLGLGIGIGIGVGDTVERPNLEADMGQVSADVARRTEEDGGGRRRTVLWPGGDGTAERNGGPNEHWCLQPTVAERR